MRPVGIFALAGVMALAMNIGVAAAQDHGTAEQAVALLDRAAKHFQEVGKEKALADFSDDKADFTDRDLYVFCFDQTGIWTAHGANKALIGRDLLKIKDANGKMIGSEMMELIKTKGEGWIDYSWVNPTTKKIDPKSSFIRRVGDQICGVGIYK